MTAAELRAMHEAATPGPWYGSMGGDIEDAYGVQLVDFCPRGGDFDLIVSLRNAAPLFVAALAVLESAAVEMEDERLRYVTVQVDRAAWKAWEEVRR